jgi:branched-subunit amino acid ABC-type transport system permease component
MDNLAQLVVNGLVTGAIIAMGAVGASLIFGVLRIGNFAHGDYLTLGAYAALFANVAMAQNLLVAALVAIAGTALFAILMEFILFRPMRGKGSASLFIITIGLAMAVRHVIYLSAGSATQQYDIDQFAVFVAGPVRFSPGALVATVAALITIPAVGLLLSRTRIGKSMRALANEPELAAVSGIDTDRVAIYTWALAGGLAGLAGILFGLLQGTFNPELGWAVLFLIFTAVILGGIGSAYGALLGGLAVGLLMELSTWSGLLGGLDPRFKPVVAFVTLILLLLYRPQGFFGKARLL